MINLNLSTLGDINKNAFNWHHDYFPVSKTPRNLSCV